ncbi:predicted protein [Chaetoceros tenuissimus]|uniref:Uncharacterized protein n=1 Tax=Chaetoceros tenuissimus TaxID=426638 RepID=A0AAD3DDH7_9STRA|nr:predicted protein [Chaetoceros tenuissimus]
MRVIIKDKENVQFMKDHTSDNDVPIASYAPAACDVSMIKELIRSGVAFNATSLLFALRRDDLATFEYLLDVAKVRISDRKEKEKGERIVFEALLHEKYKDAFEMLMRNGFICFTNLREALIYMIALKNPTLDRVKFLLNEIETDDSDEFFHRLVSVCVKMRRMDILSYINTSIRDIDVESYILDVFNDDEEAVEFLRGML